MKKKYDKKRLLEVMSRLDKTLKPRLNEEYGGNTSDPTKEEMVVLLQNRFQGMGDENMDFDIAAAIYWFGNDYHGGQSSNLYSALSTSDYRPGPMHKSVEDDESETATMMYQELVDKYGGAEAEPEIDNSQWMGMSMNEKKVDEVFGLSRNEKEGKANQQKVEQAKQEIQKYPPSHLFAQPGRNSSQQDNEQLMRVRIDMANQSMPTLAELMPQLFDLTQPHQRMVQLYNGKPLQGLVPSNWYYFLIGAEGYLDNEQAVRKLIQQLDALGQGGIQEDENVIETIGSDNPEEYQSKVEQLKQTIDSLFNEGQYDVLDTLFRLLVDRKRPVVAEELVATVNEVVGGEEQKTANAQKKVDNAYIALGELQNIIDNVLYLNKEDISLIDWVVNSSRKSM